MRTYYRVNEIEGASSCIFKTDVVHKSRNKHTVKKGEHDMLKKLLRIPHPTAPCLRLLASPCTGHTCLTYSELSWRKAEVLLTSHLFSSFNKNLKLSCEGALFRIVFKSVIEMNKKHTQTQVIPMIGKGADRERMFNLFSGVMVLWRFLSFSNGSSSPSAYSSD